MFVTNWISTTKIQKISEITNFFRHYFLSRTEVDIHPAAVYPELKQPAMRHVAYHLAQFKAILVGDVFVIGTADRCNRGVGIDHLVFFQTILNCCWQFLILHTTSPPLRKDSRLIPPMP